MGLTKKDLEDIMYNLLSELNDNIKRNILDNTENKKYDIFKCFDNEKLIKYMTMGRSFDSQLGNKLQKIAFCVAKMRYGFASVPNYIFISEKSDSVEVKTVSFPLEYKQYNQKIVWLEENEEIKNWLTSKQNKIKKSCLISKNYKFAKTYDMKLLKKHFINKDNGKKNNRKYKALLIDLGIIYDRKISLFEIKAGGNLDTKNTKSNISEVEVLFEIGKIFPDNSAYFATCYNNRGEGNVPDGSIFAKIDKDKLLVGSEFWKSILPSNISYDEFIELYRKAFKRSGIERSLENL